MNTTEDIHAVQRERGRVYGEPHLSHENIGLEWTGILQQHYGIRLDHPLPHWLVELMLASFKIHRAARVFHADNFLDAKSYLAFAEHGQASPGKPYEEHLSTSDQTISVGAPQSDFTYLSGLLSTKFTTCSPQQ